VVVGGREGGRRISVKRRGGGEKRLFTYNITFRCICVNTVAVEKQ